jgi:hypothetical protein
MGGWVPPKAVVVGSGFVPVPWQVPHAPLAEVPHTGELPAFPFRNEPWQ